LQYKADFPEWIVFCISLCADIEKGRKMEIQYKDFKIQIIESGAWAPRGIRELADLLSFSGNQKNKTR
jgi:hypothetical protein